MRTPEGAIKAKLDVALKQLRKKYVFKPVQLGYGTMTLDYLMNVKGNFVAIEVKADKTKSPTPRQIQVMEEIKQAGGHVYLVNDDESIEATVAELIKMRPYGYEKQRKEYQQNYHKNHPMSKTTRRRHRLKQRFSITPDQYDALLRMQNGTCYFCDAKPEDQLHGVLCVDHDHNTKVVRGLICRKHNQALMWFGDSEAGLEKALAYVRGNPLLS